jgi:hypothetical protein
VTWIEIAIVASFAGLLTGIGMRRHRWARLLALFCLCALVLLLVVFGVELVRDLT